jgi:hypothetical protein
MGMPKEISPIVLKELEGMRLAKYNREKEIVILSDL